MSHPTFENAGAGPGTEIWTIENFEPVPIDRKMYGKFYNGDSYIVLKTSGTANSSLSHDAHFWLGSQASQDKVGAAALWTVTLDEALGGRAVHHREVQGHEGALFLGYFKPAIRYLEGGSESGFTEVEINAGAEKRLLKLKGADNMRIEEVPAEASSLTSEHCFILEVEHDIFVLMPDGAKATQRRKIISVANGLRDDYHNGRATIEIIDEFSSDDDYEAFFAALGSGSKDDLASEDGNETYARDDVSAVYLYRVVLGDEIELVALSKPYKQRHLSSGEVYILDSPDSGVYLWLGAGLDTDLKKNYYDIAQRYLADKGYPAWVSVSRVSEGAESCTFKQYFHDWESIAACDGAGRPLRADTDAGYFSGDAEESAASARLIGKSAAARGYMPDAGDGSLLLTRVCGTAEEVTDGVLWRGAAYLLRYTYQEDAQDAHVIYVWIGADASPADKLSAIQLASELEDELAEDARVTAVRIPQGRETKHFLSLFKGTLAILYGDEAFNPQNARGTYAEDGIRLFRVEGTQAGVDMRAVQCAETAHELQDDDVFVLETPTAVYVRTGKETDPSEYEAAVAFVGQVLGGREVASVEQGQEPEDFWEALGGPPAEKADPSAWRLAVNRRVTPPHTLTAVTVTARGRILFEDFDTEFSQEDLSEDGVYILDSGEELYLWQGRSEPARARAARSEIIKIWTSDFIREEAKAVLENLLPPKSKQGAFRSEYIADDGLDRTVDSVLVVSVRQGAEPRAFTRLFHTWDNDMWDNLASYEDIKNEAKAANSK